MIAAFTHELRRKIDGALKLAVAGSILVAAGFTAFVCFMVAIFLWTQQTYGTLEAWVVVGAIFLAIAIVCAIALIVSRRRSRRAPAASPRPQPSSLLQDPAVVVAGLQLARTLGARGMLPLLVVGAVAGGLLMNRNGHATRHHTSNVDRGSETGADN